MKNFLKPTKLTWVVFVVIIFIVKFLLPFVPDSPISEVIINVFYWPLVFIDKIFKYLGNSPTNLFVEYINNNPHDYTLLGFLLVIFGFLSVWFLYALLFAKLIQKIINRGIRKISGKVWIKNYLSLSMIFVALIMSERFSELLMGREL